MKIYINYFKSILLFSAVFFTSCETLDLEQTENPSALNSRFLDPVFTFNYAQLQLPDFVDSANDFTQRVTRQMAMTGGNTYDNAFAAVNSNNNWSIAYNLLNAIKIMEPKAIETKQFYALGAAKMIRCYVLITLVDLYGDIPYFEALLGNANLTPKYDKGADVYKSVLLEIDNAIALLSASGNSNGVGFTDLYYGKSTSNKGWITLGNTLKLKMYNSARLAGADIGVNIPNSINTIVAANDYINTTAKDFAFNYSNSRNLPNSRHPLYNDQYEIGGGAYIGNYMFWTMTEEKKDPVFPSVDIADPRTKFYFCKQVSNPNASNKDVLPFTSRPAHYNSIDYDSFYIGSVLCTYAVSNWITNTRSLPSNGYWGRDHGDNSGIPADANLRSVAGLYPAGGKYASISGDEKSVQNSGVDGAKGAGVMPIIMSSFVHFMLAEAILTTGVSGNAKTELLLGINQSIDRTIQPIDNYPIIDKIVRQYPNSPEGIYLPGTLITSLPNIVPPVYNTSTVYNTSLYGDINIRDRSIYIDFISSVYDNLSTDKKLELIEKEFYIASWGNGIEPYNNYRRTGYPSNFQPTFEPVSGGYFYSALYAGSAVNNNPNIPANLRSRKVFWDKSNLILH